MKIKIIIVLFVLIGFCSFAQERDSLDIRILDTTSIHAYKSQKGFTYIDEPIIKDNESWLRKFLRWLSRKAVNNENFSIRPIFYMIMFATFVFLIYFLSQNNMIHIFERKKSKKILELSAMNENIIAVDFTKLISDAEAIGQYRLAVRFRFNQLLQKLNDAKKIEWAEYKTNFDFIHELKNNNQKEDFKKIATLYDYVWYGEQPIHSVEYDQYCNKISNLIQKIS